MNSEQQAGRYSGLGSAPVSVRTSCAPSWNLAVFNLWAGALRTVVFPVLPFHAGLLSPPLLF